MRMPLLSEFVFTNGQLPPHPHSHPRRRPPPHATSRHEGRPPPLKAQKRRQVRVTVNLVGGVAQHLGTAIGESQDWNIINRTQALCERFAGCGVYCESPLVSVVYAPHEYGSVEEKLEMVWNNPSDIIQQARRAR